MQQQVKKGEFDVSQAVVNRLPRYYRCLKTLLSNDILRISSNGLAELMNTTASQIRQDFNCFGGFGQQGYGYNVKYLYTRLSNILGINDNYTAVMIGTGDLTRTLVSDPVFAKRGVMLKAIFGTNPAENGIDIYGYTVRPIDELKSFCLENKIDIAVLTSAGDFSSVLTECGLRGVWNYTASELDLSEYDIAVQNVCIGDTLMTLCYEIKQKDALKNGSNEA